MKIPVWLYPANSVLGGTIEPRFMVSADSRKVYFFEGSGAKRSAVFFTIQQDQLQSFKVIWQNC